MMVSGFIISRETSIEIFAFSKYFKTEINSPSKLSTNRLESNFASRWYRHLVIAASSFTHVLVVLVARLFSTSLSIQITIAEDGLASME